MRVTIELEQMEFRAPHGCYDLEKRVGNRYHVDLQAALDRVEEHNRERGRY